MGRPPVRWPNVERHLVAWLADATGRPVFTETRPTLGDHLPAYQVERVGGSDLVELGKEIHVEVTSIAGARGEMWDAVALVETAMSGLAANGTDHWYVDDVREAFAAAVEPSNDGGVRRASATYALTLRPQ